MVDKSNLLHQMRKHAQTFSSAVSSPLVVDEANINRALVLIDVAARDSGLGVLRKMSFKIPPLLRSLRLEKNLDYLKAEVKKRIPEAIAGEGPLTKEQQKKEYEKFKRAEQKLRKLLDTKDC
jgi:hypothetical protein